MAKLVGFGEQSVRHYTYDASGTITSGSAPQLLLPQHQSRSLFFFLNNSTAVIYVNVGGPTATCTITSGKVNSGGFTITNAGFGYTKPPLVRFLGGGLPQGSPSGGPNTVPNSSYVGGAGPGFPSPPHPAAAHAVLTTGAVTSIVLDDPGAGYVLAPYVQLVNSDLDPNGAPIASATQGFSISGGGSLTWNASCCPTDPISIFSATSTSAFTCKFMT